MIWVVKRSKNDYCEYLVAATPQELETAVRQFQNEGWCDCSLVEQVIEKSCEYRMCAVCGKRFN